MIAASLRELMHPSIRGIEHSCLAITAFRRWYSTQKRKVLSFLKANVIDAAHSVCAVSIIFRAIILCILILLSSSVFSPAWSGAVGTGCVLLLMNSMHFLHCRCDQDDRLILIGTNVTFE